MNHSFKTNANSVLKGFGQIMLQESVMTGILFIVAICYDSLLMGAVGLLSSIIGTYTAKILKFDKENIHAGLYGFNPVLVGIALVFYFQPSFLVWVATVVGCVLSTLFMEFALRKKSRSLSCPLF